MVDCVSVSVSVYALSYAVTGPSTGYDGTCHPNMLKRPLKQTIIIRLTKAGFVVNINFWHHG